MLPNPLHVAHPSAISGPRQKVTTVRISVSPPASLNCRETAPPFAAKYAKPARISRYFVRKADWRERTVRDRMASICWPFSGGHKRSPVSVDLIRRMQCDHEPMTGRRRLDLVKPLDAVRRFPQARLSGSIRKMHAGVSQNAARKRLASAVQLRSLATSIQRA